MTDGQNPYNLPTPNPGEILPVEFSSFELMNESEENDPHEGVDDAVEASEDNFNLDLNG